MHSVNGKSMIALYLSPFLKETEFNNFLGGLPALYILAPGAPTKRFQIIVIPNICHPKRRQFAFAAKGGHIRELFLKLIIS